MPASVRTGWSTGGTGNGTLKGPGSLALLGKRIPVEPSPEQADAPKGRASATPPASPSFKNSRREISMRRSPLPSHDGPRPPGDEVARQQDQKPVHGV